MNVKRTKHNKQVCIFFTKEEIEDLEKIKNFLKSNNPNAIRFAISRVIKEFDL